MPSDFGDHQPGVLGVFQSKEETKAYYNKIAWVYDLLTEHTGRSIREKGLTRLAARPGESILEIGFGTGHCLVELAEAVGPSGRAHGIDISDRMLSLSHQLLEKKGLAVLVHRN